MIISEQWLREWVSPRLDTQALADRLTLAGLEVGAIQRAGPLLPKVVVAKILAVERHPRADRLSVCQVDVGRKRAVQIVCGAPNVSPGRKAAAALIGARLADGTLIEKVRLRDVVSSGMLCSASELGLQEDSEGLLYLDANAKVGTALEAALRLDDHLIEIDLTPNRGDCLSIAGVAREVSVLTGSKIKRRDLPKLKPTSKRKFPIRVSVAADCPRYVGRVIEGVDMSRSAPLWMRERLRRGGIRSINAVVDVTNYVMLELGQPMHGFDLAKLVGGVVVRHAKQGEAIRLLDGSRIKLEPGSLVIADHKRAVALAGIMGGEHSAISEQTTDVLLEAAHFRAGVIAGRARRYGLHTDSSHRFERGVDAELPVQAMEYASTLLLDTVGGQAGPVLEKTSRKYITRREPVALRHARLEKVLGTALPKAKVQAVLGRLSKQVRSTRDGWKVTPPSYRFDLTRECDLIEEVVRVWGYDQIPSHPPAGVITATLPPESRVSEHRLRNALIQRGFQEVITYSFVDAELHKQLDPKSKAVRLANPLAANMSEMRNSLWPGLIQTLVYNRNRQHQRIRIFEMGHVFAPGPREHPRLGGAITGLARPEHWDEKPRGVDFFDLKADVQSLLQQVAPADSWRFSPGQHPALQPGQTAVIKRGSRQIGLLGRLHPDPARQLDLDQAVYLFEIELGALQQSHVPAYQAISRFPLIRRDLAVLVDREIPAQAVLDTVRKAAGRTLTKLELFDVYRGEGIDSQRKSLAFGLTLQDSSRTLKETDIEQILGRVMQALRTELGGELRS